MSARGLLASLVAVIAAALGLTRQGAIVAGLLWALHPGLVFRDSVFATESLFNVCTVASVFFATRRASWFSVLATGLLIGIAGLVRPLGLLYLPAALVLTWPRAPAFAGCPR